jgi:hypothetical protein
MEKIYKALGWVFGVSCGITALTALPTSIIAALCIAIVSALLLPPVRERLYQKTNIGIPSVARAIAILVLIAIFGLFMDKGEKEAAQAKKAVAEDKHQKMVEEEKQKNIEYFKGHSENILSEVREAVSTQEWAKAISLSSKYLPANNSELKELHTLALAEKAKVDASKKTVELLASLEKVDKSDIAKRSKIYAELSRLNSNNKEYAEKASFYEGKQKEEQKKALLAAERRKQIESQFSQWDGSHRNVEAYIKRQMHNPDSYKHEETRFKDNGDYILVITSFRGTNAFGGVVKNTVMAKVDIEGKIIEIMQ